MKQMFIFATAYPYTAGILALVWIGSALLLTISASLSLELVLLGNMAVSTGVALVGFRK